MSYEEVCEEVEKWAPEEREQLARRLKILQIVRDPEQMSRLSRGMEEIRAGGGVSREELLAYLRTRGIAP